MLKKMMILTFIAVTMLLKVYAGQKHAVIITGDYRYNKEEYKERSYTFKWWNDTVALWYMLVKEQGYSPENVYVLFAGGEDYTTVIDEYTLSFIPAQYRLDVWEQYDEYGFNYDEDYGTVKHLAYSSASDENICDIFDSLATVMSDDDMLFVAAITHGGYVGIGDPEVEPNMDGIMLIWDDVYGTIPVITDYKFASLIEQVPANKKVFWLAQCHSGTFVDNLENMKDGSSKIINTSCQFDEVSRPADNLSWTGQWLQYGEGIEFEHLFEEYSDDFVIHDEFTFHMYTSTTGNRPFSYYDVRPEVAAHAEYYQRPSLTADYEWFPISEADLNNDGIFSTSESFEWLDKYVSISEQNGVYSDLDNVGKSTSLLYPTLILDDYPNYMGTLKGIMAIPLDLTIGTQDLVLPANSHTTLLENRKINIGADQKLVLEDGSELIFEQGADLVLSGGSELFIENYASVVFKEGSKIEAMENSRIRGSFTLENNVSIEVHDNSELFLQLTRVNFPNSTTIKLGRNAKLIVENGSDIAFGNGINIELSEGAEIVVGTKAYMTASGTNFNYAGTSGGNWLGINAISGSSVSLDNVSISDAVTGVKGTGNYQFDITNSTFEGCLNGIDIAGMTSESETGTEPLYQYKIMYNTLTGIEDGRGITITQSDGVFSNNSISHFGNGVCLILCSPEVVKNEISYNKYFGMTISGQNAMPELVNYNNTNQISKLNNVIKKNGYENNSSLFPSGNIGILPYANVYMRYNDVISSPRFYGISVAQLSPMGNKILIDARSNYWGSGVVTDDYFFGHVDYTIDYTPYFSSSCSDPLADDELTAQAALLMSAVQLELKGNYTAANKLYEVLMKRYENTPEYYISMNRLANLYAKAGWDNGDLLKIYNEAYESEGTTHKKFFKGAKVTANIKGKRYNDAIAIAEEMKSEADFEEEIILADINIAIANMLKDLENNGKSKTNTDYSANISELLTKLNGTKDNVPASSPADITESVLPERTELFQNYPNPFNPVTQIKFALANTANVKLSVYNISGQMIVELANGSRQAGVHAVDFDGSKLNSGVYYYTLEANGQAMTKKMVLTK